MSTTTFNTTSCICYRYLFLLSPHSRPTLSTDPRRLSTLPPTLSYPASWYVYFSTLSAPLTSFFPLFFLCFSYVCLLFRLHFLGVGVWRSAFRLLFWVCFFGFAFLGLAFGVLAFLISLHFQVAFSGGWRTAFRLFLGLLFWVGAFGVLAFLTLVFFFSLSGEPNF